MIVYTPIDIKCKLPSTDVLTEFVLSNYMDNLQITTGYDNMLCAVAFRSNIRNWRDAKEIFLESDIQEGMASNELYYAPGAPEELKEILKLLPYKTIMGAWLSLHTTVLNAHRDDPLDITHPMSPERYNVLLTPHYGQDSFFISRTADGKKDYPTVLEDYPIYAFNNKDTFHGADIVLNQRIIMICAGIIDHSKHEALIQRSADKFTNYVIRYED